MFHLYGFVLGMGILSGIGIARIQARHWNKNFDLIEESLLWIALPAVIGARAYHVITDWHLYTSHPFPAVLEIWNGGLGLFGALIGGMLGLIVYVRITGKKRNKLTSFALYFLVLDLLSLGAPLAQSIGRVGNYANQELYGLPTELPWGILVHGVRYHPLFAYEAILNLLLFLFLNWLSWTKKLSLGKGQYACMYFAVYSLIRFWLEFLRPQTARWNGVLSVFSIAQWVCIVFASVFLLIFWLRRHADRGVEWELKTLL